MPKTLLNAVNEVFKRVSLTRGDNDALTSLTDTARQHYVDVAVQVVNEGIDELYSMTDVLKPLSTAEDTIVLVADERDYILAADLVTLHFPLSERAVDSAGNQIVHYPGGYEQLIRDQPTLDDFTGDPTAAVIRPTDGLLYLDRKPTTDQAGDTYTYIYDKETVLTLSTDEVPFEDIVFRAMVPVWSELWKRDARSTFDQGIFAASLGRAGRKLLKIPQMTSYRTYA